MRALVTKILAEMAGTFAVIFAGFGSILLTEKFPGTVPWYTVPFVFGTAVLVMIFAVGSVSGAHFNPAVTLAFVVMKRFPADQIPVYWTSQFLGGWFAVRLLASLQKA